MTKAVSKIEPHPTRQQAAFWYWRLRDPQLPESEWQRWSSWIAVPDHQQAFESLASDWEQFRRTPPPPGAIASFLQHEFGRIALGSAAACIATVLMATVLLALMSMVPQHRTIIQTDSVTDQTQTLKDGSIVRLAPGTRLELEFGLHQRVSYLVRGKAYFNVAKDPRRQFTVRTKLVDVAALGTRFGVSIADGESIVTVQEGHVRLAHAPASGGAPQAGRQPFRELKAREQARVSAAGDIQILPNVDPKQELMWATVIVFTGETILDALAEFNRRASVQVELSTTRIAPDLRITGVFQLDHPEGFAQFLANSTSSSVTVRTPDDRDGRSLRLLLRPENDPGHLSNNPPKQYQ